MTFFQFVQTVAKFFLEQYTKPYLSLDTGTAFKDVVLKTAGHLTHTQILQDISRVQNLIKKDESINAEKIAELRNLLRELGDKFLMGVYGQTSSASLCFLISSYIDLKAQEMQTTEQAQQYFAALKTKMDPKGIALKEEKTHVIIAKKLAFAGNYDQVKGTIKTFFPEESYLDWAKRAVQGLWSEKLRYVYFNAADFTADQNPPKIEDTTFPWQLQREYAWFYYHGKIPLEELTTVIEIKAQISHKELAKKAIEKLTREHQDYLSKITADNKDAKAVHAVVAEAAAQKAEHDKQIVQLKNDLTRLAGDQKAELTKVEAERDKLVKKLNDEFQANSNKLKTETEEKIAELQKKTTAELAEKDKIIATLKEQLAKTLKDFKEQPKRDISNTNPPEPLKEEPVFQNKRRKKKKHQQSVTTLNTSSGKPSGVSALSFLTKSPSSSSSALDEDGILVNAAPHNKGPSATAD